MRITVLADHSENPPFCSEFGLSLLVNANGNTVLFDTGAGSALLPNLRRLGIPQKDVEKVILSHGHCDHTGGLAGLSPRDVWCCSGVCNAHFSRHADGEVHLLTMPEETRNVLLQTNVHYTDSFEEILPGFFLTGPVPRISGEDCGGDFFHDAQCTCRDTVEEEQALLTKDGFLVTGCCHAGIINTLLHCMKYHPEIKVHTVIGGLHLVHADESRLKRTADFFRETGICTLALLHCTGESASVYLQTALPGIDFPQILTGQKFIFASEKK